MAMTEIGFQRARVCGISACHGDKNAWEMEVMKEFILAHRLDGTGQIKHYQGGWCDYASPILTEKEAER